MGAHPIFESDFDCLTEIFGRGTQMSNERKRNWSNDDLDEDELLGNKKGKLEEVDDADALLLNDTDDELLKDSDDEDLLAEDPKDEPKSEKSNGEADLLEEPSGTTADIISKKERHDSVKSNEKDILNLEEELDYDDFSEDEEKDKRERFTSERKNNQSESSKPSQS